MLPINQPLFKDSGALSGTCELAGLTVLIAQRTVGKRAANGASWLMVETQVRADCLFETEHLASVGSTSYKTYVSSWA